MNREEADRLGKALRYDLTAAQGKLTELLKAIDEIDEELELERHDCPVCGLDRFRSEEQLADHQANVHGVIVSAS